MNTPPRKQIESGLYAPVWREFNKLIDYVREISITGGRNVRVNRSLNGTTLAGVPESRDGTGNLNFRGEYDPTSTYVENDVVIYGSSLNLSVLSDGKKAGTYIATQTITPEDNQEPGEPNAESSWKTFARFATPTFAVASGTSNAPKILMVADADSPRQVFTASNTAGIITIDLAHANGKQISLREIGVCVNGVNKKMLVLGSEIY